MTDLTPEGRTDAYLIVKRDLYYRPNAQGYTGIRDHAGRYTLAEVAEHYPNRDHANQDGITVMHEDDAPEFTDACYHDLKEAHIRGKLEAQVAHLTAELTAARATPAPTDNTALVEAIKAIPRRKEVLGGQTLSYVQLGEVLDTIEDLSSRAADASTPDTTYGRTGDAVAVYEDGALDRHIFGDDRGNG